MEANKGNVSVEVMTRELLTRIRWHWESDASGDAVYNGQEVSGIAYRYVSSHNTASSGTYSVRLLDEDGGDWILPAISGLTINQTTVGELYQTLVANAARELVLDGVLALKIAHSAGAANRGIFDLWLRT